MKTTTARLRLLTAITVLGSGGLLAPDGARAQDPTPAAGATIQDLAFLTGCWAADFGSLVMEERWTAPAGGSMLATTRFLRAGGLADWEFSILLEEEGRILLRPHPRGVRSEHDFPLVSLEEGRAVFENLEHDFPVRIIYRRDGPDRLTPRIEGADGEGREWALERVGCGG